ncbi:MAG: ABC transporter substrate-binding protein [Oscillospiraceae bacterium]|jgi:branched-chain amino acid transport system substrate-binding protein|nr:ABC transporter substrate-binding protein [Oscillospiraceae bacterium]
MKKFLAVLLTLAMVLALTACGNGGNGGNGGNSGNGNGGGGDADGGQSSGEPIKVGVYLPLSGANAAVGQSGVEGIEMAVEEINAAGGIAGRPIEIIKEDEENDPTTAVSVVNKLINQDEVVAIIGSVNSSVTLAAMEVSEDAGIPMVTPISSGAAITGSGNQYIVRGQANDLLQAGAVVEYAIAKGYQKIGLMYQNDDYGGGARDVIVEIMKENNMTLAADEGFEASAADVTPQLQNVKAAGCDCLIMYCMYAPGATIANQAAQLGMGDLPLLGGGGLTNAKLYELGGENVVGVVNSQTFLAGADAVNEFSAKFIENFQAKYNDTADSNNAMAYDSTYILAEGLKYSLEQYNDLSGDHIMEGMKAIKDMPLATGTITIDETGDSIRDKILMVELCEGGTYKLAE